jgi:hypothetical protein
MIDRLTDFAYCLFMESALGGCTMKYRDEDEWEDKYFDDDTEDEEDFELDDDFDPNDFREDDDELDDLDEEEDDDDLEGFFMDGEETEVIDEEELVFDEAEELDEEEPFDY